MNNKKLDWFLVHSIENKSMSKTILSLEHPRSFHMVGDWFRVTQYIPGYNRIMNNDTSPFLMLDYNAPWSIPPQSNGYRPGVWFHPHRGFETVTIVYSWEIEHEDTAGNGWVIWIDEVQWMTAGSGLLHNEFMTESFANKWWIQHAVQLWINLPKKFKMTPPRYQSLRKIDIPEVVFSGGKIRIIAGEYKHIKGIAETFSDLSLFDIRFQEHDTLSFDVSEENTAMLLITEWTARILWKECSNGDMITLSKTGTHIHIEAENAKILFMGGRPLNEPIVQHGPFVMNTEEEIKQAFDDFHTGKMG